MRRRRPRGFTLVELMTVVAIIGIIAALAVMSLGRTRSQGDADAWANTVRNVITLARRRATATATPYMIELGPTTLRYCQIPAGSCSADATLSCATVSDCTGAGTTCEKGATLTAGSDARTDAWAASADALALYQGGTATYSAPARTTLSGEKALYFGPVGSAGGKCSDVLVNPPNPALVPGFTIYVRAANAAAGASSAQAKHRRVVVYGVTGRPRIIDQW